MLDEFPALGRLDFFESALAFMAGYGLKAFLIAQSLNQIEKAYGQNNSILDNCHVRISFASNDERTAKARVRRAPARRRKKAPRHRACNTAWKATVASFAMLSRSANVRCAVSSVTSLSESGRMVSSSSGGSGSALIGAPPTVMTER